MRKGILGLCVLAGMFVFGLRVHAVDMPRVVINELQWMGSSNSSSDEWLELKNTTSAAIDVTGWSLTKLSSGAETPMLTIPSGVIPAQGFFVIANFGASGSRLLAEPSFVDTDVSLVNSRLQIRLYDAASVLIDTADDGVGAPLSGEYVSGSVWKSMERNRTGIDGTSVASWHTAVGSRGFDDGALEWGTPGTENSMPPPHATLAPVDEAFVGDVIAFDASESTGDALMFLWDFGDGATGEGPTPTHAYASAGTFTVRLTVSDGENDETATQTVVVNARPVVATVQPSAPTAHANPPGGAGSGTAGNTNASRTTNGTVQPRFDYSKKVALNEVLPDPDGPDEAGEYIEVINRANRTVNVRGWSLSDGKKTYVVPEDLVVASGAVVAFARSITKIVLGNATGDTVELRNPDGAVMSSVSYEKSVAGQSYAADERGAWQWTMPTPFGANVFSVGADYEDALHDALQSVASAVSQTADDVDGFSTVPTANASAAPSVVSVPETKNPSPASIALPSIFAAAVAGYALYKKKRTKKEEPFWQKPRETRGTMGE